MAEEEFDNLPKPMPYPRKFVCEHCKSELEYDREDLRMGEYGCMFLDCPLCNRDNMIDDHEDNITLTMDNIKFPVHFHHVSKATGAKKRDTLEEVRNDGRIHTIFTQTLTRTGRLSSISPNLQNIPARAEHSRLIRKAFVPDDGCKILASDYSQVELRVFAHMSEATNLINAFINEEDIHTDTFQHIYFGVWPRYIC